MKKQQVNSNKHPQRIKHKRLNLAKALFVLPNLFTLSSVACGFYAITRLSTENPSPHLFDVCAVAIFMAAFFDMFDGRVARLTKTQSEFGGEMDSLADVISFGVAPALMVYRWGLESLSYWGIFAAFVYVACGAIRLARFNVMAQKKIGSSHYFIGLPIPGGATMIVSMIIFHQHFWGGPLQSPWYVAACTVAVSLLMVSNVRYRTFKDLHRSTKVALALLVLAAITVGLCIAVGIPAAAFTLVASYLTMGILEWIIALGHYKAPEVAVQATGSEQNKQDEPKQEVVTNSDAK